MSGPRPLGPDAPALPTTAPLIVYDDVCVLCSRFVRWVVRHDPAGVFRFTSVQGPLGEGLYRSLGLNPDRLETILLIEDGAVFMKSAAVANVARRLGGVARGAGLLRLLPDALGDGAYDLVARNRYRLFGRRDVCWTPPPHIAERIL